MSESENQEHLGGVPSASEDTLLDAFLSEAFGRSGPPDVTASVLAQVAAGNRVSPALAGSLSIERPVGNRHRLAAAISLIAASVAVLAVGFALRGRDGGLNHADLAAHGLSGDRLEGRPHDSEIRHSPQVDPPPAGHSGEKPQPSAVVADPTSSSPQLLGSANVDSGDPQRGAANPSQPTKPAAGTGEPRSLAMDTLPFSPATAVNRPGVELPVPQRPQREKDTTKTIQATIKQRLADAWKEFEIQPTGETTPEKMVVRLQERLAIQLPPEAVDDAARIADALRGEVPSRVVSQRLLLQVLGPGWKRLSGESQDHLTNFVATSLADGKPFDELIRQFFVTQEEGSPAYAASKAWLSALAGQRSVTLTQQIGRGLLDMDLACARCHDHPIDSRVQQHEFWTFAAVFHGRGEGLYYERPDGRQRIALPNIPHRWVWQDQPAVPSESASEVPAIANSSELATRWISSPQLARSIVNRAWTAIYGRPLTGSASEPDAPPHSDFLAELRDYLADQLLAEDFDVVGLFSWIATAPPMRLEAVLESLSDEARFASQQELAAADFKHRVFAGFESPPKRLDFDGLLALAQQWNGGTIVAGPNVLAQARDVDLTKTVVAHPSHSERVQRWLRSSFPAPRQDHAALPAQWLESIDDYDQQVLHLFYAAGYWKPTETQLAGAMQLRSTSESDFAALRQLWWILRNSQ